MTYEILKNFVLNICFLVVVENILLRFHKIKSMIEGDLTGRAYYRTKFLLAAIFGAISICSTYIGVNVNGAIVNTRVIGVIAGGIIGGPIVGMGAALIAGLHRYLFDIGGFTSLACTISTLIEGLIGVTAYLVFKERRWEKHSLFLCGALAEIIQMIVILAVARPYQMAMQVVSIIALPMIFFNSIGLTIFVTCFRLELIRDDNKSAENIRTVFDIMDQCLPYIRNGLKSDADVRNTCKIIMESSEYSGAVYADQNNLRILMCQNGRVEQQNTQPSHGASDCVKSSERIIVLQGVGIPASLKNVMKYGQVKRIESSKEKDLLSDILHDYDLVVAPIISTDQKNLQHNQQKIQQKTQQKNKQVIGCIGVFTRKNVLAGAKDEDFISGLAKLLATQLELNQYLEQRNLLQKAEFQALQSQINPHFLFNALNTVSSFCRTKPERARSLLVTLSDYFRKTLEGGEKYFISFEEEMQHVRTYTMLEEARFEDRLSMDFNVDPSIECMVPSLILQPIVENAIKHGAMKHTKGRVSICAKIEKQNLNITVRDTGDGIPKEILAGLYNGTLDDKKVGMANVHKRLKNIYGDENGLKIKTSVKGTMVRIRIPVTIPQVGRTPLQQVN